MPNAVSGRVVKTRTRTPGRPTVGRSNSTPSLRPIQFRCIVSTRSGQPGRRSHQASSSSAYAVILKNQPSISRGVTSELHRQQRPSSTCSLARTVWQEGHLVTGEEVADRVVAHVTHVNAPGRVRKHLEAVELRAARVFGDAELLPLLPGPLPLRLDLPERVSVARHNWARVLHG